MEVYTMTVSKAQMVKHINGIIPPKNVYKYIPIEKLCLDLIVPQILFKVESTKDIIKFSTMTNPVMGWF